jgi:hypothetical protein
MMSEDVVILLTNTGAMVDKPKKVTAKLKIQVSSRSTEKFQRVRET